MYMYIISIYNHLCWDLYNIYIGSSYHSVGIFHYNKYIISNYILDHCIIIYINMYMYMCFPDHIMIISSFLYTQKITHYICLYT